MHKTSWPSASRRRQRWEPRKPAPPVTMILFRVCMLRISRIAASGCGAIRRGLVVVQVPGDKAVYPLLQGGAWGEANSTLQIVHIGAGGEHVPRLHGQQLPGGGLAHGGLDCGDKIGQRHRAIVANIV